MEDSLTILPNPGEIREFGDPHPDEVSVEGVIVLGYDAQTKLWLALRWQDDDVVWLVGGGKNTDESFFEAALRELAEETGFNSADRAFQLGASVRSHYYNDKKKIYRASESHSFLFILDANKKRDASLEAHEKFDVVWLTIDKLKQELTKTGGGVEHWLDAVDRAQKAVLEHV